MSEIVDFDTKESPELSQVGGKALALIRMSQNNFPVPPGFVLSIPFFASWINELEVTPEWQAVLRTDESTLKERTASLKKACQKLSFSTSQRSLLEKALEKCKINNPERLFAVRSSSPEEDLDDTSFAGGYETVLGVTEEKIEEAVLECFSSCFDEGVYIYKRKHKLPFENPRIAVIVQTQINADVAGVAFSINPVNNCYDEAVLNANYGLGESVVSGKVEPDFFVVDKVNHKIIETRVGSKDFSVSLNAEGGTVENYHANNNAPCISPGQVSVLLELLIKVESDYDNPVDIEWAFSQGKLYLLQVRPITTYYPLPKEMVTLPGKQKRLYANSTLIEQGLQEPLSVLGAEFVGHILKSMGRPFGGDITGLDGTAFTAGGRYYMNLSYAVKMSGKKMAFAPGSMNDDTITAILDSIDLNQYLPDELPEKMGSMKRKMVFSMIPMLKPIISAYRKPENFVEKYQAALPGHLQKFSLPKNNKQTLLELAVYLTGLLDFFNVEYGIPMVLAAQIGQLRIRNIFKSDDAAIRDNLANLGVSLPGNKTAEMGAMMYQLASSEEIKAFDRAHEFLVKLNAKELSPEFLNRWDCFMDEFGARCPGEIDLATVRPRENPALLFNQLKTMALAIAARDGGQTFFNQANQKREAAYRALYETALRKAKSKAKAFKRYYKIWSVLGGYREMPKHYIIKVVAAFRQIALEKGAIFAEQGRLNDVEQIFDLTIADIDQAETNPNLDLRLLAKERSAFINKARRCHLPVRIIDSRGKVFYPITSKGVDGELTGISISPGVVRGRVKVFHSATEKKLLPGEILVARATDPGWTPLFINAGGIILEIGGVLQHGAVIAREYGIPCVSGVDRATEILTDGQWVEVDGSSGRIRLEPL